MKSLRLVIIAVLLLSTVKVSSQITAEFHTQHYGVQEAEVKFSNSLNKYILKNETRNFNAKRGSNDTLFKSDNLIFDNNIDRATGVYDAYVTVQKIYDFLKDEYGYLAFDNLGTSFRIEANLYNQLVLFFLSSKHDIDQIELRIADNPLGMDVVGRAYMDGILNSILQKVIYRSETFHVREAITRIFGVAFEQKLLTDYADWTYGSSGLEDFRQIPFPNPEIAELPNVYDGILWKENMKLEEGKKYSEIAGKRIGDAFTSLLGHWFYLLSEGGQGTNELGDSYQLEGIGVKRSIDLLFYAVRNNMKPNVVLSDFRTLIVNSARELYGPCSNEVEQVRSAFDAIGLKASTDTSFRVSSAGGCLNGSTYDFIPNFEIQGICSWDFGDGSSSVAISPSHIYGSTGDFNVQLNVIESSCESSKFCEKQKAITIYDNGPIAACTPNSYLYEDCYLQLIETDDQELLFKNEFQVYEDLTCSKLLTFEIGKVSTVKFQPYWRHPNYGSMVWLDLNDDGVFEKSEKWIDTIKVLNFGHLKDFEIEYTFRPDSTYDTTRLYRMRILTFQPDEVNNSCETTFGSFVDVSVKFTPPVNRGPEAGYSLDHSFALRGENFTIQDFSSYLPESWKWTITGPETLESTDENPTFTFNTPGYYHLLLEVENQYGSDSKFVERAFFVAEPHTFCDDKSSTSSYGVLYSPVGPDSTSEAYMNCEFSFTVPCAGYVEFELSRMLKSEEDIEIYRNDELILNQAYCTSPTTSTVCSFGNTPEPKNLVRRDYLPEPSTYRIKFVSIGSAKHFWLSWKLNDGPIEDPLLPEHIWETPELYYSDNSYTRQGCVFLNDGVSEVESHKEYFLPNAFYNQYEDFSFYDGFHSNNSWRPNMDFVDSVVMEVTGPTRQFQVVAPNFYSFTEEGPHQIRYYAYKNCSYSITDFELNVTKSNYPLKEGPKVTIVPNPTKGQFVIHRDLPIKINMVEMFNYQGQSIKTWNTDLEGLITYETPKISTGMYIVKVHFANGQTRILKLQYID